MDRHLRQQLNPYVDSFRAAPLTRRNFLQRSVTLGAGTSLLAAILRLPTAAAAELEPGPQVLDKIKQEGKKLFVYNWEDYIHPRTIPHFEKTFGVKVTYDTFPSNEHLLAKLQAGAARYDVIFPTHNFLPIYRAQGLLAPLNHEHLPNLQHVHTKFLNTPFDPGNTYAVPYGWGMTGIAHNTKHTQDDTHLGSWALLFQESQKYARKIGFTDEREEVIAAALLSLGYAANSRNKDELRQAGEVLLRLKPRIKAFYPGVELRKALMTEDVVVAQSWSGEVVKARAKNAAVAWNIPKEGGTGWFDTMVIPKKAAHKLTAEVFINFMLRPDVAADNANTTGYATANRTAVEQYVAPQVVNNPAIYPSDEALGRITFLETIPDELLPTYDAIWTRLLGA